MGNPAEHESAATTFDTEIKRTNVPAAVRERIWGRSAARCVLCSKWLVDETEFWHAIPTGQIAHNIAAENGPKAPRGDSKLSSKQRAEEANLLLLCGDCHRKIDSSALKDKFTVQFLTDKKNEHESWVRDVTNFARLRPAIVIRMTGTIRGTRSPATKEQIGEALREAGLTGMHADSRTGLFDITTYDDESDSWTWAAARKQIDMQVQKAHEAIAAGDASVLAVFALAPIPMLIHLGAELDDKTETVLFRRDRSDAPDAWTWTAPVRAPYTFQVEASCADAEATDVVAFVDVTASVDVARVPAQLAGAPSVRLLVTEGASSEAIASRVDLVSFAAAWRELLSTVERQWPRVERLHILAAVPGTAAVTMGRHRMRGAHPTFVLYQHHGKGIDEAVMEVAG
ncbi:SAVED domain-containing protein [Leucobacter rhizosphaerae]|uniref:SAVED domain-containing protein n=1 Tax=Leucobacter rhizosphaerae TaxID=2932245 RepID=A0ABY4FWK9_9MICO|nr:SAVED domain-containing protein [Leucobacter rhizosphaerae]UOQ60655.1 SAVED domain-containing protein [Leucobacter rhizosphaerae]